jgi:hypothetical protein
MIPARITLLIVGSLFAAFFAKSDRPIRRAWRSDARRDFVGGVILTIFLLKYVDLAT